MRKLVLFGLLAFVFGLALALEHFVTRPGPARSDDHDKLVMVIGGVKPRDIPPSPPVDPTIEPAPAGGKRDGNRPASPPVTAPPPTPIGPRGEKADLPVALAKEHVVEKGETLASIARAQLGSSSKWRDLARWNGIDDPNQLRSGARLRLTPPDDAAGTKSNKTATPPVKEAARTHKVAKGDTLSHLAALYLGDAGRWREIQRLNAIADPANLTEGSTLQLPQR